MDQKYIISEFYDFKADKSFIKESEEQKKTIVLSGILQKANTLNKNGRVYPYPILKREVERYMQEVDNDSALGELNHPDSAVVDLNNVCIKVIDMWWENEVLYGKIEVLDERLDCARRLVGLLMSDVRIGISSRGVGSVKNIKGQDVVQEDFELIAFDIVSNPSTPGAYMFKESKGWGMTPLDEWISKTNGTYKRKENRQIL